MQPAARAVQLLAGTAPVRKSYLLLHHALPPSAYPAQLASFSSLLASVQLRCAAWDVEVNLAYLGPQRTAKPAPRYSPQREAEITLFSFERRVGYKLPALSCRELDRSPTHPMYDVLHTFVVKYDTDSYLLVCTHGRCADTGGAVAAALRRRAPPSVRVGEIAHAGGRECVTAPLIRSSRHAANVLVCPSGDWFGGILPEHADLLLRYIADGSLVVPRDLIPHWRGGRGLSQAAQTELAHKWLAGRT